MQIIRQKKSLIKLNILKYIEYKQISKYKFYKESGITRGILDQDTGLTEDNIAKFIAYAQDINPEWLLTGKGPMLKEASKEEPKVVQPIISRQGNDKALPLLPVNALAGLGSGEVQVKSSEIEQWYQLPDFPQADFLITISGDSMLPTYKSGDIAICKRIIHIYNIVWGRLYVIYSNDMGALFKRIYPADNDEYLILRSDNSQAYPDIKILKTDIVNISLVLGIIRKD